MTNYLKLAASSRRWPRTEHKLRTMGNHRVIVWIHRLQDEKETAEAERDRLKATNSDLLSALRWAVECLDLLPPIFDDLALARRRARDAIARAGEDKP